MISRQFLRCRLYFRYCLIFVFTLFLRNSFAQEYTQWELPEGATAILGKGDITGNIAFSPDGLTLANESRDRTIHVWAVRTGEHLQTLKRHTAEVRSLAYSPDGLTLASGSSDNTISSVGCAYRKRPAYARGTHGHRLVRSVLT